MAIAPRQLSSNASRYCSTVVCVKSPAGGPPAFSTRMSTPPNAPCASRTKPAAPSTCETSATIGTVSRPMPAAAASIVSRLRPQIATLTPSAASACATPSPKPLDAAATAARRPVIPRSTLVPPSRRPAGRLDDSVNRARSVAQRLRAASGPQCDDFGAHRDCRFLGRAGTDVEPDGRHDARDLGLGQPGFPQALLALLVRPPRSHGAQVADLGLDRGGDGGHIELVIVRQHADRVARSE